MIVWVIIGLCLAGFLWESYKKAEARRRAEAWRRSREEAERRSRIPGTAEYRAKQAQEAERAAKEEALRAAKRAQEEAAREAAAELRRAQAREEAQARTEGRFITDWQSAERAVAWAMKSKLRCTKVRLTSGGADAGVDVDSAEMSAQVKYQTSAISRPVVQQTKGAAGGRMPAVFGYGETPDRVFTKQAIEWADLNGVALFAINAHGALTALSVPAQRIGGEVRLTPAPGAALPKTASTSSPTTPRRKRAGDKCPNCGGTLARRTNHKTRQRFLGCSNYPICRRTYSLR